MAMLPILLLLSAAFALSDGNVVEKKDAREGDCEKCPSGWTKYKSHCFIYDSAERTWSQAELHCLSLGGNLVSVHSTEENEAITTVVSNTTGSYPLTWIGGTDIHLDRVWFWSDGTKYDYSNWEDGEPNNFGGREPCIVMNWGDDHRWNDFTCDSGFPSVCSIINY